MPTPSRFSAGWRHRVSFEQETRVADGGGGWLSSWSVERSCWGRVEPLRGRELLQAQQLQHAVSHKITIRHVAAVAAYHRDGVLDRRRISFRGRAMRILAIVNPDERDEFLEILAQEGTAA